MAFDLTTPQPSDKLSLTELDLYHEIMKYRAVLGLDPIPLSSALTATAGRHAADTLYNIWDAGLNLPDGANLHSWSNAPYYGDHRAPEVIWWAPERIGIDYPSHGFEISAAGYSTIEAALNGWKSSPGHNSVIANTGSWANSGWNAIGIGVEMDSSVNTYQGNVYHVWFGTTVDPAGAPTINGTSSKDAIKGTMFADNILGFGGADIIYGRAGQDILKGGNGNDKLHGHNGTDRLVGGSDKDKLWGGWGEDNLRGGKGSDALNGGKDNDILSGGMHGDTFVFTKHKFGNDVITDFKPNDIVRIGGAAEASNKAAFVASLTSTSKGALYDHESDGVDTILFEGVKISEIGLGQIDFI